MNDLQVFDYQDKEVRTVQIDGETWFVLKDVCSAIGIRDHVTVSKRLDEDEVGQAQVIDGMGRSQETAIVNESGLYSVILRSDKPEAKPFRKWVTSEVLPALRKTGQYQMKPLSPAEMFAAQAQVNLDHERQLSELARRTEQAEKTISEAAASLPSLLSRKMTGKRRSMPPSTKPSTPTASITRNSVEKSIAYWKKKPASTSRPAKTGCGRECAGVGPPAGKPSLSQNCT